MGTNAPHLVLGIVWQLVRKVVLKGITSAASSLGADPSSTSTNSPEQMLLAWMNKHISSAGLNRSVSNFGEDLKDGDCYLALVHSLAPAAIEQNVIAAGLDLQTAQPIQKLSTVLQTVDQLGCCVFLTPNDICNVG